MKLGSTLIERLGNLLKRTPMAIEERKKLISRILESHRNAHGKSLTVPEQSIYLWHQMAQQITPLIGDTGFQALYGRAAHFALPHCPGFKKLRTARPGDDFVQALREDLAAMEKGIADQCNTVLITKFAELVSEMIGDTLIDQILHSAWDAQSAQVNPNRDQPDPKP